MNGVSGKDLIDQIFRRHESLSVLKYEHTIGTSLTKKYIWDRVIISDNNRLVILVEVKTQAGGGSCIDKWVAWIKRMEYYTMVPPNEYVQPHIPLINTYQRYTDAPPLWAIAFGLISMESGDPVDHWMI